MNNITLDNKDDLAMRAISLHMNELRQVEIRLSEVGDSLKGGSPTHRGLQLVLRDLRNATESLQRLQMQKRPA